MPPQTLLELPRSFGSTVVVLSDSPTRVEFERHSGGQVKRIAIQPDEIERVIAVLQEARRLTLGAAKKKAVDPVLRGDGE